MHTTALGGGPLTQAALRGTGPAAWYPGTPASSDDWTSRARATARGGDAWLRALTPALGAGSTLLERVATGGVVVTTGQQPGLFGGPLYTWYKALTALEVARTIERMTGVPAAPVFWAATDDADFAEAATTIVATPTGPRRLTLTGAPPEGVPMSQVAIGAEVDRLFAQLREATTVAGHAPALDAAAGFAHGATVGGAYVGMLRALLEPLGIAVLDASADAVATAARPLLEAAMARSDRIHEALVARDRDIRDAGFSPQVDADRDLSLVFAWSEGADGLARKSRLRVGVSAGNGRLSANVLLRPVVERAILPTVAYVGGPGEIAYFAQVSAVADALGVAAPLIVPRWSGMMIPDDTAGILERYGLQPADLRDPHAVERSLASAWVPSAAQDAVRQLRVATDDALGQMGDALDPRVVEGTRGQFAHRIERLERRLRVAAAHRNQEALREIAAVRGVLYPFGKVQERALNAVPLWARLGAGFVDAIRPHIATHADSLVSGAAAPV